MKTRSGKSYSPRPNAKRTNKPGSSVNWARNLAPLAYGAGAYLGGYLRDQYHRYRGIRGPQPAKGNGKGKRIRHPYWIRKRRINIQGGYGLKKYPKTSKKKVDHMKVFHMNGYVDVKETNGSVSDPDCVFLGYSAQSNEETMGTMIRALFRKLFKKCVKFEGIEPTQEIPGEWVDDTGITYKILLILKNVDTNAITVGTTYETANNDTIQTVASQFVSDFRSYANGYSILSNSYTTKPFKIQLYKRDRYSATATDRIWSFVGEINLEDLVVHVSAKATIKMQNRTEGAGGSADAEDVNNNPLVGRRYITNGLAKTRDDIGVFEQTSTNGVKLTRAAALNNNLKEPPPPGYFVNVKSTVGIKLMPGEIRYGSVSYKKSMLFMKFLKLMRYDENGTGLITHNVGPEDLYALEDAINFNGTELITIGYEVNRTTGVYFTEKRNCYSQGLYSSSTQSNNP